MARSEYSANAQLAQAAQERRAMRERMAPQAAPRKQDDSAARAEIMRRLGVM